MVVNDIRAEAAQAIAEEILADGGTAVAHAADIADWDQASALIHACVDRFGALDGLVNNGAMFYMAQIAEETPAQMRRLIEVNVLGTLYPGLHALRHMLARGRGSIVNVTSGSHLGIPGVATYGATKGAVASLTYCWAAEVSSTRVRVNAISPMGSTC